jgi:antitoxin component of RelBE/YafQ-DinJ toxin-antitoxin module
MSSTEIITIAVDSDLINRAKAIAAKLEISVDELLNFELRYLLESLEVTQR